MMKSSNDDIEATSSISAEGSVNCCKNSATVDNYDTSLPSLHQHPPSPSPLNNNYQSSMSSADNYNYPPLVKRRRAFSYECASERQGSCSDTFHSPLRTIPSKCEMNEDDNNIIIDTKEGSGETLFATPTRTGRGSSYSTPERRINNNQSLGMNNNSRDRANTCPHRPQHLTFEEDGHDDEEGDDDEESCHHHERSSSAAVTTTPDRAQVRRSVRQSLDSILSRAHVTAREEEEFSRNSANNDTNSRDERRSHSSPSVVRASPAADVVEPLLPRTTPSVSMFITPRRLSSRPRAQTTDGTTTTPTPTTLITIPNSPAVNRLRSYSSSTSNNTSTNNNHDTTTPISPLTATQQRINQAQTFLLFRVNPLLIKLFMITSLYVVLSYTWNTDFKVRYKSMEINYGLSEYWHRADGVKLVNDDYNYNDYLNMGHDDVAKLLANGRRRGSDSEDIVALEDDGPLLGRSRIAEGKDTSIKPATKRRRPSLSYARSNTYGANHRRAYGSSSRHPSSSSSLKYYTWKSLLWFVFVIPIIEVGLKEIRRQVNIRFWNVRRLRNYRGMSSMGNVHNL